MVVLGSKEDVIVYVAEDVDVRLRGSARRSVCVSLGVALTSDAGRLRLRVKTTECRDVARPRALHKVLSVLEPPYDSVVCPAVVSLPQLKNTMQHFTITSCKLFLYLQNSSRLVSTDFTSKIQTTCRACRRADFF